MLPRKGRRKIIVGGVLYYYVISDYVCVIIHNSTNGEIIKWHEEWKPKWKMQLKPKDIEKIIRDHCKHKEPEGM